MSRDDDIQHADGLSWFIPLTKSHTNASGERILEGAASTDDWDGEDEQILQDGIAFDYFLKRGYINWNHNNQPRFIIGVPLEAGIRTTDGKPCFWIKARLLDDVEEATYAWRLAKALEKLQQGSGPDRQLGWSVEGGVLEKENGRIKKCVVRNVALTHEPVNEYTFATVAKSFGVAKKAFAVTAGSDEAPVTNKSVDEAADDDDDDTKSADDGLDKVMTSASAGALRLENLDGQRKSGDPMTSVLIRSILREYLMTKSLARMNAQELLAFLTTNDFSPAAQAELTKAYIDLQSLTKSAKPSFEEDKSRERYEQDKSASKKRRYRQDKGSEANNDGDEDDIGKGEESGSASEDSTQNGPNISPGMMLPPSG